MNELGQLSTLTIYAAMACYAIALVAFSIDLAALTDRGPAPRRRRAVGIAMSTTTLGVCFHIIGVVLRGVAAGRVPWANMYEFTLVFSMVAVFIFLLLQRWRDMRFLGAFVLLPILLGLGLGMAVFYVDAMGVEPILDNYWLIIHVSIATIAVGVLAVAAALSVVQLIKLRQETLAERAAVAAEPVTASAGTAGPAVADVPSTASDSAPSSPTATSSTASSSTVSSPESHTEAGSEARGGRDGARPGFWQRWAELLPASATLERYAYRLNAIGFLLWTFTLIAGAIWAEHAWGRAWGWDAKETWTFVIWVAYAGYLHARATRGWDGRKAAYFCLAAFLLVVGNYFIVNLLLNTQHGYAFA